PLPGENLSAWAKRYSSGVARGSGAGGAAAGRELGDEVSRALLSTAECQPRPKTPPPPKPVSPPKPRPKAAHNWMKGFDLRKSRSLGAILAAERAPVRRDTG